jgi:predicted NBD/HSP70 family sugar kinase/biotin operon repressor
VLEQTNILRQVNSQMVIEAIMQRGPISRAALAQQLGLSKPTVSAIVRELEEAGWIHAAGEERGRVGSPAIAYRLSARAGHVAGIDLGGTKIRAALCGFDGGVLAERVVPTDPRGGHDVVAQIAGLVRELAESAGAAWDTVRAVAVGSPGVANPETGVMELAPNITSFGDIPLRDLLCEALGGVPVELENDVNMAALGEHWQGHAQGLDDFAFIAVGTGIGMGLIVDGDLRRGARGAAGEIAYLPLGADPFDPATHLHGALEEAVSGVALVRRYAELSGDGAADRHRAPKVFEAARAGDEAALQAIDDQARIVALAGAAVAAILDPGLIVLGGGIGSQPELADGVRTWLDRAMATPTRVEISRLGERASIVGAIGVALRAAHRDLFAAASIGAPALPAPTETREAEGA